MKKKYIVMLIALILALSCGIASAETYGGALGSPLADFSVETIDGGEFRLSEALAGRDLVLINLWATWCPPCESEFPFLEEAYELYQDRVAVLALSVEPTDDPETLREYAESHGMTFPVGSDTGVGLAGTFVTEGIPTTLVVDRLGNVAFVECGAQTATEKFTALFDHFLDGEYTATEVLSGFPQPRSSVEPADPEALSEAVGDDTLNLRNPDGKDAWPMLPEERDGRSALASTNGGVGDSASQLLVDLTANEGGVLAFDVRVSCEPIYDALRISVDGDEVKCFTGERDWSTWAVPLEAGPHTVCLSFEKDSSADSGEDRAWIDNIQLLTGEEADAALEANPKYPVADAVSIAPSDGAARRIEFDDPDGFVLDNVGTTGAWIAGGSEVDIEFTLTAACDPEAAMVMDNGQTAVTPLTDLLKPDGSGYGLTIPLNDMEETGYPYTMVFFIPRYSGEAADDIDMRYELFFRDEAAADQFVEILQGYDAKASWKYVDGEEEQAAPGESVYTVRFLDQNGDPVPGCVVNFCTDSSCTPVQADEYGFALFTGIPCAYHLQVIAVPEGYALEGEGEVYTEACSQEIEFKLIKG